MYSSFYPKDGVLDYISYLDDAKPVKVVFNHFANKWVYTNHVVNLFDIIDLYNMYVPVDEDWFVSYRSGFDFDENVRDRDVRKYTKGLVFNMMLRLCHYNIFREFQRRDIIKYSWDGEVNSFFRPYYVIHVEPVKGRGWF